jgi:ReqiPepy6 Gp37-like protein
MDVFVMDTDYNLVGVVDLVESIIWTDRYQGYGDFEFYTPANINLMSLLKNDYYLQIKDSDRTMILESFEIKSDVEKGTKFVYRGRSLESILTRRIVMHQTQISTNVQTAIADLIDRAFINPEDSAGQQIDDPYHRTIPNMYWSTNADPGISAIPNVVDQFFGQELYDVIKDLAQRTGIGFKILLTAANEFEVNVYLGRDRSYAQTTNPFVIFSPTYDNLINSSYFRSKQNYKSLAYVFSYLYDTGALHINISGLGLPDWLDPSGLDHRERYLDLTSLPRHIQGTTTEIPINDYNAQVVSAAKRIIFDENKVFEQFEGLADTTVGFKYGVDFFLGDIVQMENEFGMTGRARITEITFAENPSGNFVYPTFEKL